MQQMWCWSGELAEIIYGKNDNLWLIRFTGSGTHTNGDSTLTDYCNLPPMLKIWDETNTDHEFKLQLATMQVDKNGAPIKTTLSPCKHIMAKWCFSMEWANEIIGHFLWDSSHHCRRSVWSKTSHFEQHCEHKTILVKKTMKAKDFRNAID